MLAALMGFIFFTKDPGSRRQSAKNAGYDLSLVVTIKNFFSNKSLLFLYGVVIILYCAGGMSGMLFFLFINIYLESGERFALMFLVASLASVLAAFTLWPYVLKHWGAQRLMKIGALVAAIGSLGFPFLQSGQWQQTLVLVVLVFCGSTAIPIAAQTLISCMADYTQLKWGRRSSGVYFSVYAFLNKAVNASAGAVGLAVAAWFGFDPTAEEQNVEAIFGLHLLMGWLPFGLFLFGAFLSQFIPITSAQHRIIQQRLERVTINGVANPEENEVTPLKTKGIRKPLAE